MPEVTMKELLEAGVHFGHQTRRWNPKMRPYIFGKRNGIYIIDLQKAMACLRETLDMVREMGRQGRTILFVGTKRQARQVVKEEALHCKQFFMTHRWLGGTLTNFVTIRASIDRLRDIENRLGEEESALTKKELLRLERERIKMQRNLEGIREMDRLPDALFVVDPKREHIAVAEANKLNIPVIAIVDTNCNPEEIDYIIPGNDDAIRTIRLISSQIADAYREGSGALEKEMIAAAQKRREEAKKNEGEVAVPVGEATQPAESAAPVQ